MARLPQTAESKFDDAVPFTVKKKKKTRMLENITGRTDTYNVIQSERICLSQALDIASVYDMNTSRWSTLLHLPRNMTDPDGAPI